MNSVTLKWIDLDRSGKCMDCSAPITVERRSYLVDGREQTIRVRTACHCQGEYDPYEAFLAAQARPQTPPYDAVAESEAL
jgi:hypothetical protein